MLFTRFIRMESRTKTLHEMLLINGFAKVANDPIVQGPAPHVAIGVGRHEDCRNRVPRIDEVSVELESGHRGHLDVGDQAGGFDKARGCEEIGRRRESLDVIAERPNGSRCPRCSSSLATGGFKGEINYPEIAKI
jgi:hypothetical protein